MLRAMDDDRMRGWRLELAIAAGVVVIIPILGLAFPGRTWHDPWLNDLSPVMAELIAVVGLVWMVRIWRGPLRDGVPAWRYRDRR
jgi:uncharacterized membrane protein